MKKLNQDFVISAVGLFVLAMLISAKITDLYINGNLTQDYLMSMNIVSQLLGETLYFMTIATGYMILAYVIIQASKPDVVKQKHDSFNVPPTSGDWQLDINIQAQFKQK